jgi:hypothetical protein
LVPARVQIIPFATLIPREFPFMGTVSSQAETSERTSSRTEAAKFGRRPILPHRSQSPVPQTITHYDDNRKDLAGEIAAAVAEVEAPGDMALQRNHEK